jgi:osmotically-inducible protein OsmY
MNADTILRQKVLDALEWEPGVHANNIGVTVHDGVVTLTGHVKHYAEKLAAEHCVQSLAGVRGVAQDIEVRLEGLPQDDDDQIAERAAHILAWSSVPDNKVKVKVEKGWLTLSGEVDWNFQRDRAEDLVSELSSVRGITNLLTIKERIAPSDVKAKIENAFKRNALLDASKIIVKTKEDEVTLTGDVPTFREKQIAHDTVWAVPGVHRVVDNLRIS